MSVTDLQLVTVKPEEVCWDKLGTVRPAMPRKGLFAKPMQATQHIKIAADV